MDRDHVASYATLINRKIAIPSASTNYVAVERHFFNLIMACSIELIALDEDWYQKRNPDVREAIRLGHVRSAQDHYIKYGYFEHRLPYPVVVDETWYLASYEDVASAIQSKSYESGQAHFEEAGFAEGRMPHQDFVLRQRIE